MKKAMAVLAVLSLAAFAGQNVSIEAGVAGNGDGDWLQYDDGTYNWLTWGGTYRGVWFNIEDFIPGMGDGLLEQSELWFYHHSSYPWDTSDVYIELYNGDAMGPQTQLDQTMVTAIHGAPIYVDYDPMFAVEANFWCLANTEMSAGGWPAILGDNYQGGESHSFFSDDFIVWEPWTINDLACNYFVRVNWNEDPSAFDNTTWGSLKATF